MKFPGSGGAIGADRATTAARGLSISVLDVRDGSVRHEELAPGRGWYAFTPRLRGEGTLARRAWRSQYVRATLVADAALAALAGAVGYLVRFGPEVSGPTGALWIALALPLVWVGAMLVARSYEQRFL